MFYIFLHTGNKCVFLNGPQFTPEFLIELFGMMVFDDTY